ncbi:MAG TPA: DinB family protein [Gemmatimonadales bacterium]|nr:DinB family protein [Gemmatimonadales bacterium]
MEFDLRETITMLERTPAVVRELLHGLPERWTVSNEGPDTFSPFDVVGHLIDGEETDWIPRLKIILAQGPDRRFVPFDRFRSQGARETLAGRLDRFASLRKANLAVLRDLKLTPAQLTLTGEHPELGTVTLAQLLATWAVHDLTHLAQINRVMAKQYKAAIGPWVKYHPLLTR